MELQRQAEEVRIIGGKLRVSLIKHCDLSYRRGLVRVRMWMRIEGHLSIGGLGENVSLGTWRRWIM